MSTEDYLFDHLVRENKPDISHEIPILLNNLGDDYNVSQIVLYSLKNKYYNSFFEIIKIKKLNPSDNIYDYGTSIMYVANTLFEQNNMPYDIFAKINIINKMMNDIPSFKRKKFE